MGNKSIGLLLFGFILLISFSSILESVQALETIEVPSLTIVSRTINLVSGQKVTGNLTVLENNSYRIPINFWITDPSYNAILEYDNTLGSNFSFNATNNGIYTMYFRSIDGYTVLTLDYSIATVPEFSTLLILPLFMIATLGAWLAFRRRARLIV